MHSAAHLDERQLEAVSIGLQRARGKDAKGKKSLCGAWTLAGRSRTERKMTFARLNCGCWDCSYCGPRKAKRYKHSICRQAEENKLTRFLTLTLDPKKMQERFDALDAAERAIKEHAEGDYCEGHAGCVDCKELQVRLRAAQKATDAVAYIRACWSKWRVYLHRKYGESPKYITVLEFHKPKDGCADCAAKRCRVHGLPHLHIVIDRFIEQAWIKETWQAIGGGLHVHIQRVDVHRVSHYLSKYLTKELLLSAPERTRRITTARAIKLIEKIKTACDWIVFKAKLVYFFERVGAAATSVCEGADGIMQSFVVQTAPA